jgi:hypothetical protein
MKRHSIAAVFALPLLALAGCSDYPLSGIVDAQDVFEESAIEKISGSVYGLKVGAGKAASLLSRDTLAIDDYPRDVWLSVVQGVDISDLDLSYPLAENSEVVKASENLVLNAKQRLADVLSAHNGLISEIRHEIATHSDEVARLNVEQLAYDSLIMPSEQLVLTTEQALKDAQLTYNSILTNAQSSLSDLASREDLPTLSGSSPLSRFQYIDYSKRTLLPADCPDKKGYAIIDNRSMDDRCVYINVPSQFIGTTAEPEAQSILETGMQRVIEAKASLGDKNGWGSEASGLYLSVQNAKSSLNLKVQEAAGEFGSADVRMDSMNNLGSTINTLADRIAVVSTEEYIEHNVIPKDYLAPEAFMNARSAYVESMKLDFEKRYFETAASITMDVINGHPVGSFKGIGEDYESVVAATNILFIGRADALRYFGVLDLTDKIVTQSARLEVVVSKADSELQNHKSNDGEITEDALEFYLKNI